MFLAILGLTASVLLMVFLIATVVGGFINLVDDKFSDFFEVTLWLAFVGTAILWTAFTIWQPLHWVGLA